MPTKLLSVELARELGRISADLGRQVGILINRQGRVVEAFVGESTRIFLPDLGRVRVGAQHFRGLRHVHTVLQGQELQHGVHVAQATKVLGANANSAQIGQEDAGRLADEGL
ncbi:MAG: hypothetical protein EOO40_09215, partial [Deltaproteobacteria bacterium]